MYDDRALPNYHLGWYQKMAGALWFCVWWRALQTEFGAQCPSSRRFPGKISSQSLWIWQSLSVFPIHVDQGLQNCMMNVHDEPYNIYQGTCCFYLGFRLSLLLGQGSQILRNKVGNLGWMPLVTAACLKIANIPSWKNSSPRSIFEGKDSKLGHPILRHAVLIGKSHNEERSNIYSSFIYIYIYAYIFSLLRE